MLRVVPLGLVRFSQSVAQESRRFTAAKDFASLRLISELGPFPSSFALRKTPGRLAPRTLPKGSRLVLLLRKFGPKLRRVLQLVHAGSRVYQWKLSVLRRELVSGYAVFWIQED